MPITVRDIHAFKQRGEGFIMLTAYDGSMARLLDRAGVPVLLVGDTARRASPMAGSSRCCSRSRLAWLRRSLRLWSS